MGPGSSGRGDGTEQSSPGSRSEWWEAGSPGRISGSGGAPWPPVDRFGYRPHIAYPGWQHPAPQSAVNITAGSLVLFFCGILMMVGSVTAWVSVHALGHTASLSGTELSGVTAFGGTTAVNGWFTFTGGVALLVLGGLLVVSRAALIRLLAILVAAALLGFAVYDLIRVLQALSKVNHSTSRLGSLGRAIGGSAHLGFGLVIVVVAALGAMLAAISAWRSG